MPTFDELLTDKTKFPDDTKVTLAEGVEVSLKDLRAGYMKDADYRQKTTAVAREREHLNKERADFQTAKAEAEVQLQQLAAQIIQGGNQQQQHTVDEVQLALERDPVAKKLLEKVETLEAKIGENEKKQQTIEQVIAAQRQAWITAGHRQVLGALKGMDKDLDEKALVEFAQETHTPRLDVAYRALKFEDAVKAARKQGLEEGKEKGIEEGKRQAAQATLPIRRFVPELPKDAPATFSAAKDAALADPEILDAMRQDGLII